VEFPRNDEGVSSTASSVGVGTSAGGSRGKCLCITKDSKYQTVGSEFRRQLNDLMSTISYTTPHYIRCIKPNSMNTHSNFQATLVSTQLKCCGVIEAVRVSRAGFPNRFQCEEFISRYSCILTHHLYMTYRSLGSSLIAGGYAAYAQAHQLTLVANDMRSKAMSLCSSLAMLVSQHDAFKSHTAPTSGGSASDVMVQAGIQVGHTLVFMRRNAFDILEQLRMSLLRYHTVRIQCYYRRYLWCHYYRHLQLVTLSMQCQVRYKLARMRVTRLRQSRACVLLQCLVRGWLARVWKRYRIRCVVKLQTAARGRKAKKLLNGLVRVDREIKIAKYYRR
jgi:myosin-5